MTLRQIVDEMRYWQGNADPTVRRWASALESALAQEGQAVAWRYGKNATAWYDYGLHKPEPQAVYKWGVEYAYARPAAPVAGEWLPIETAPKDRKIDIFMKSGGRWTGCYYDTVCDQWRSIGPSGHMVTVPARHVTHWMEIPAAPTPDGGTK